MRRVVVTGLGFISSIGNSRAEVLASLRSGRTGIEIHPELDKPEFPVKLAGTVKHFSFPREQHESWEFPAGTEIPRQRLRSMPPHATFAFAAMREAIADAGLPPELVSHPRTGIMCASAGSARLLYKNVQRMVEKGILRCPPFGLPASITGTLNFNLIAAFKIRGASGGFSSACAASAHAFGAAMDCIRLNREDTMFVVGAEDCDMYSILPFASVRALTRKTDPREAPCAFDVKRDGFAATGGSTVLVLEELEHAKNRGATIYAEALGWGQSSDGHDVMAPEPNGEGISRAIRRGLHDAGLKPADIDYINAHATATQAGDRAELRGIKGAMDGARPRVSSTKSQSGHGLSLAGAMEAGFCCLGIKEGFTPHSINITELDPETEGVEIVMEPNEIAPRTVLSNSSAFGGSNVVLALQRFER